jgi:hypothetical protein
MEHVRLRGGADVGVVDHPLLDEIRIVNARSAIPTIIASHNLESLDVGRMRLGSRVAAHRCGIDFGNELWSLARFHERLAISRMEAAVLNGVGLTCKYYPYVPCGEVRAQLIETATERSRRQPDRTLFLVMGTAFHAPTRRSLQWLVEHARTDGLPKPARVVLVGSKVEELVPCDTQIPRLEVRGRVSDKELAELLLCAGSALVPQRMGFGAVTRIPELACAGVPALVFPHASYAMDLPPGARVLDDDAWCTLVEGMRQAMDAPLAIEPDAYAAWEARQARPLGPALGRVLARQPAG